MKKQLSVLVLAWLGLWHQGIAQEVTIINTAVLSVEGNVSFVPGQTVTVKEGQIVSVKAYKSGDSVRGKVIDGSGLFLIPGLIDCYTHVHEKSLILDLVNGVTTVVNAIGEPYQHQLKLKVDAGELLGPRIFSVGSPIASPPPLYHSQGVLSSGDEAALAVRETKRLGYDAIFTYVNVNEEVYLQTLKEAQDAGLPVLGHTPFKVPAGSRFHPGQISHNNLVGLIDTQTGRTYPAEQLGEIARALAKNGTYVVPTLTIHKVRSLALKQDSLRRSPYLDYELPRQRAYWRIRPTGYSYDGARSIVDTFYKEGVKLLIGTDGGFHFVPHGYSYPMEMLNFADLGIPNSAIMRAATIEAARYLRLEKKIGSIEEGKIADMVLLRKNPLEDIHHIREIEGVMVRGTWLSKDRLEGELETLNREIKQLATTRSKYFRKPPDDLKLLASYSISIDGVVAGEERLYYRDNPNGTHVVRSVNVIDPPLLRVTETEWVYSGETRQMRLKRTGTEGETRLNLAVAGDTCAVIGRIPLSGEFSASFAVAPGTVLAGPNTSVNIDMDLVGNLFMLLKQGPFEVSKVMGIPVLKAELNSEEWSRDAVVGQMKYLVTRKPDESGLNVFEFVCRGFNGDPAFEFKGIIRSRGDIVESVTFDDRIVVRRLK